MCTSCCPPSPLHPHPPTLHPPTHPAYLVQKKPGRRGSKSRSTSPQPRAKAMPPPLQLDPPSASLLSPPPSPRPAPQVVISCELQVVDAALRLQVRSHLTHGPVGHISRPSRSHLTRGPVGHTSVMALLVINITHAFTGCSLMVTALLFMLPAMLVVPPAMFVMQTMRSAGDGRSLAC